MKLKSFRLYRKIVLTAPIVGNIDRRYLDNNGVNNVFRRNQYLTLPRGPSSPPVRPKPDPGGGVR